MAAELTLGAEEELHLIDLKSWHLSARAPQILSKLPGDSYSAEIQRTTVETNTAVAGSLDGLRSEILRLRRGVLDVAAPQGIGIAAVGTAPRSEFADFELTTTGRFGRMQEQYRLLVDEQLICGTQIHVGLADRDLAVQVAQRVSHALPILLALSASSPYWNGNDTGYASIRSIIWQRWPSAGATGPVGSAAEYDELLTDLIGTGVIADAKMAYFEVRPSAHAPTLELRVCDACPIVDDAVLIAGLFRAAVRAAELDVAEGRPYRPLPAPIHRAAMWQAARGGLSGNLLDDTAHPRPIPAAAAVRALVDRLRPQLEELGDLDQVRELAETTLARGNSADRQRVAFAERGELDDVVELVVQETHGPPGGIPATGVALTGYRIRAGDEAVGRGAQPYPAYRPAIEFFSGLGPDGIAECHRRRDAWVGDADLTFGVGGEAQPFLVDLMPRMISMHEWAALETGLRQRARAIEAFLRDVYTEQRVLRDGVVPSSRVLGSPGWRAEAARLPGDAVRAPIIGFDLVRDEFGGWRVLEDNARTPSGIAYGIGARELMDAVVPGLPRPSGLLDPRAAFAGLAVCLRASAPAGDRIALLSSGPGASAWWEHRRLAKETGFALVGPDDLAVRDGRVVTRADGREVHGVYLRLDGELLDLQTSSGSPIGADIVAAAQAGAVALFNAPGNGVADDKAMYCYLPELITYYLDEHPILESVPTYRPEDEAERHIVLERVGELVTKPVDGHGGVDVLIGPTATAQQVAARRLAIARDPARWVAQEVVRLSSLPAFTNERLAPRSADLRAFVLLTGVGPDEARLAPVALTRVAREGSLLVNSSQGGGAKDTWIVLHAKEGDADVRAGR